MKYQKPSALAALLASVFTLHTAFSQDAMKKPVSSEMILSQAVKSKASVKQVQSTIKPAQDPAKDPVNRPNINAIDAQEIEEGGKFNNINLKEYVSDEDHRVSQLKWTVSGYKDLKVSISGGKLKVKTPSKDWNGRETVVVKVTDPAGNTATGSVDYVVESINDLPVIKKIKGEKIQEGKKFKEVKLDDFIKDADHKDSQISWNAEVETIAGFRDEELTVIVDKNRIARIKAPHDEWYGKANVTFTAADPDGGEVSSQAQFEIKSVNDKPILSKIPAQKIQEGSEFEDVALEDLVKDADHEVDQLKFSLSGAKELKVKLDGSTISIATPNEDWAGKPEKVTVTVQDPEGGKDKSDLILSVVSVNDIPEISEIEGQEIQEGQKFKAIDLSKIVSDKDHELNKLKWSFRGNKDLKVQIGSDRKAKIQIPNENWHGEETITFVVKDPEGGRAETEASFVVESINDKPMTEKKLKDQKIKEGKKFALIKLDDLVKDADHSDKEISWEAELETTQSNPQETELSVEVNTKRQAVITIPDANYYGTAKIIFTAVDPEGDELKLSANYKVESVNDLPKFQKVADQTIQEGGVFETINLADFVSDIDHETSKLSFSSKGNKKLKVAIKGSTAKITTPNDEFSGKPEKITFIAKDPEGGKASATVLFTVKSVNDEPVITNIPAQTIKEGEKFTEINLEKIVSDKDHKFAKLKWSFPGKSNLKIKVQGKKAKIEVPHENWHGEETITAKVTDPEGASAETNFKLKVTSVNDLPVLKKKIKSQKIKEGAAFKVIELNKLVEDADHKKSNLTWTTDVNVKSNAAKGKPSVSITGGKAKIILPSKDWYGFTDIKFTVTDPDGGKASQSAKFEVTSVNDKPTIAKIPQLTINEGQSFQEINLDDFVTDLDHAQSQLTWEVKGGKELDFKVNSKSHIATISIPSKEWSGKPETFTLMVSDPEGGKATAKVVATVKAVNDAPVISKINAVNIQEGGKLPSIDLKSLVKDVDNKFSELKISFAGNQSVKPTLSGSKIKLTVPSKEWNGSETIEINVKDPAGASVSQELKVNVKSVNDLPVLKKIKGEKLKEGATFKKIDLAQLVTDADHPKSQLKYSASLRLQGQKKSRRKSKAPQPEIVITDAGLATIKLPSVDYNGAFDVTYTAKDPEGGKATQTVSYELKSVNDKPTLKGFTSQKITEGGRFKSIPLLDKVSDVDHSTRSIKWDFKGNKDLKVSIDKKKNFIVKTPSKEWSGSETITLTAKDPEGGKAAIKLNYTATEVNDLPILKGLKGQSIKEGSSFAKIKLDDVVSDADHKVKELKWSISGGKGLKAKLSSSRVLMVSIPNKDWNGPAEKFKLTVKDPAGGVATQELSFEVKSVNDKPVIKTIKGQKVKEGASFKTIALDSYISDADHSLDQITWTAKVQPKSKSKSKSKRRRRSKTKTPTLSVKIDKRIATIMTPDSNWHGAASVIFTAKDEAGSKVSTSADFEVTSVNDKPVLSGFKSQTIEEGSKFKSVSLSKNVNDADHSFKSIKWAVKGNKKLKVIIDRKKNLIVKTPNKDWSGEERLILEAKDPEGGLAKVALVYKVNDVNDAPILKRLKSQKIKEGAQFKKIKLDDYVSDADHKDNALKWTITGAKGLKASISSSRQLLVEAPTQEWSGKETLTLTATDPKGAQASTSLTYTVLSVNDVPVIKKVANQTIREGQLFSYLDLNKYVSDADHKTSDLIWYFSDKAPSAPSKKKRRRRRKVSLPEMGENIGGNELQVILEGSKASLMIPDENWNGKETIYFIARDPDGAESFTKAVFSVTAVNDAPKLMPIPNQVVDEGKKFTVIRLDKYVSDADHKDSELKWSLKKPKTLQATLNKKKRTLTVSAPSKEWSGSESISLKVNDPAGVEKSAKILFKVNSVNDRPSIKKLPKMTVKEGSDFPEIDLNQYVSDPDHESRRLVWSIEGGASLKAKVSFDNKLSIIALSPSWSGSEKFKLIVKDPEGALASYKFTAKVINVNDAPKGNLDSYSVDEGKTLKISKSRGVLSNDTDEDGPAPRKAALKKKPRNGKLRFKADGSFVYTPKKGFNGTDEFTYLALDKQKAKSKETRVSIKVYFKMKDLRSK